MPCSGFDTVWMFLSVLLALIGYAVTRTWREHVSGLVTLENMVAICLAISRVGTGFECSKNPRSFPGEFDNVGRRRDVPNGRPGAPCSRHCVRCPMAGCEVEFCSSRHKVVSYLNHLTAFRRKRPCLTPFLWNQNQLNSLTPRFPAWSPVFFQGIDSILKFKAAKAGPDRRSTKILPQFEAPEIVFIKVSKSPWEVKDLFCFVLSRNIGEGKGIDAELRDVWDASGSSRILSPNCSFQWNSPFQGSLEVLHLSYSHVLNGFKRHLWPLSRCGMSKNAASRSVRVTESATWVGARPSLMTSTKTVRGFGFWEVQVATGHIGHTRFTRFFDLPGWDGWDYMLCCYVHHCASLSLKASESHFFSFQIVLQKLCALVCTVNRTHEFLADNLMVTQPCGCTDVWPRSYLAWACLGPQPIQYNPTRYCPHHW